MAKAPIKHHQRSPAELTILQSNNQLSVEEERWVRNLILEGEEDLKIFDQNIINSRTVLDELLHQRADHISRLDALRGTISPLRKFPPEILSNIFLACSTRIRPTDIPPKRCSYPWILGQVCSYWRQIVWGTPALWGHFFIGHIYYVSREFRTRRIERIFTEIFPRVPGHLSVGVMRRPTLISSYLSVTASRVSTLKISRLRTFAVF